MSKESAFEIGRLYVHIKAIADTLVASQKDVFVRIPGLVGYWPMGMRSAGSVIEHSGSGFDLTQTGVCPTSYDGNSFTHLGNGTNYAWSTAAQLGISGTQTWISSSIRGLTVGGWFMVDTSPATSSGLISKDAPAPQRGYILAVDTADKPNFSASGTGAALVTATAQAVTIGTWNFIVGRFTPSTEVAVFLNADKSVNTTAVPSSQFSSSQAFEIGRFFADNNRVIHGKARDVFISAAALSDALIEEIRVTSVP